ncbi:DNA polymerase III subunit gamma/tau [Bartonella tamiae]|uniref:DNA polymerase III subunit gamma/tau n=1 Tax=Bartonella tamiae Th239 TaxID=1094558 RepID=J1K2D7_9HYPH|nr:DNA polymerase III subunit gamma/tau [Bartonella tamiae]EJF91275.1 DNA polymerase III, subunit gamma and tau [Bartonella tamiae Th239]EJF93060.1 DNA polymerase III, subunit gamma and tau [Bartonella tamiae Th307]
MEKISAEKAYRVLARKYRPQNFDDLIGQEPMVRTLTNAFEAGRIAQAWMLTGVRGVGKTTTARILARALNYKTDTIDKPTIALNVMGEHCQAIMEGRHVDIIEMDAASHTGIDDIREIIEQIRYRPVSARYKVYIIDEVHMLSTQAFNGLLKTLEEPPAHVKFIFATTEIKKVPITVLSRCQRFDLRRIESKTLIDHLSQIIEKEQLDAEEEALAMIARAGEGSVRDALSILDQAIAHGEGHVKAQTVRSMLGLADRAQVIDLFEKIMSGDIGPALQNMRNQYDAGADPLVILGELADFNHLVTRLRFTPEMAEDISLIEEERQRGLNFSQKLSVPILSRNWQMLLKGMQEVESASNPLQAAEMLLIRLTHAADLPPLEETLKKLEAERLNPSKILGNARRTEQAIKQKRQKDSLHNQSHNGFNPPQSLTHHEQKNEQTLRQQISENDVSIQLVTQTSALLKPEHTPSTEGKIETDRVIDTALSCDQDEKSVSGNTAVYGDNDLEEDNKKKEQESSLHSLQDIVRLADENDDIHFKLLVKEYVRLVSFQNGRIEFEPAEGAPRVFAQDMAKKLREWTGERWTVSVVNEGGSATLREEEDAARARLLSHAEADPDIAKILQTFPGSKVVDVRLNKQDDDIDVEEEIFNDENDED